MSGVVDEYERRIAEAQRGIAERIEHDLWGPPWVSYECAKKRPRWARFKSWWLVLVNDARYWAAKKLWPGCTCEGEYE